MHVGQRINAIRQIRRLSIGELSRLSKVPKASISKWEKVDCDIGYKKLEALAGALSFPVTELLNHPFWVAKTPREIVSKAALDSFISQNPNISLRDRSVLEESWDKNKSLFLEVEGWQYGYELMKLDQRTRPIVAELKVAEKAETYAADKKIKRSQSKKPRTS